MKKTIIRTSGFAFYLFLFFDVGSIWIFFKCVLLLQQHLDIRYICGLLLFLYFIFYFSVYILVNKITLTDEFISIRTMAHGDNPFKNGNIHIKISEIESIFFGNEKCLRGLLKDNTKGINELNKFYKKYDQGMHGRNTRFAVRYSIVFVILTKEGNISIVSTKPFSKKGFKKLFGELGKYNFKILIRTKAL